MEIIPGTKDVFGQLPRMKGYTHLALCFPNPGDFRSRETTANALQVATKCIVKALPWVGGAVVHTGSTEIGCTGTFSITRSSATENILKIQDRSENCPSYEDILNAKGVSRQFDVTLLSAETSLPDSYTESEEHPAPVLTLTANWINGGIILDCAAQHNVLDMGGINQFLRLLAASLQAQLSDEDEKFDPKIIETNIRDRLSLFPLLESNEQICDHSDLRVTASLNPRKQYQPSGATGIPSELADSEPAFHHFRIQASNLEFLKRTAETPSLDDALSAFIWKSLSAVRRRHGNIPPETVSGFTRAIDCRRSLEVPAEYMGHMAVKTCSKMTFSQIENSSLSEIAAHLRKDVHRIRDRHWLRSLATLIDEEPDKSTFNFGKGFDPETWINASSWAGVEAYQLQFGRLGKPSLIRRPDAKPVQGILIFLPRFENGDIDVLFCLRRFEIIGLKELGDWSQVVEYIG